MDAPRTTHSNALASGERKPLYISPSTTHAAADSGTSAQTALGSLTCSGSPSTCSNSSPFTVPVGSTTFNGEVDDGTNMLADGSATQDIATGSNMVDLTLNGVASTATFSGSAFTVGVGDADGNAIVHAGSDTTSTIDNGPIDFDTSNSNITGAFSATTGATISSGHLIAPDANGNDYNYTVTCAGSYTGTATLTLVTGADLPEYTLGSLVYPASGATLTGSASAVSIQCTNGTPSITGTLTIHAD